MNTNDNRLKAHKLIDHIFQNLLPAHGMAQRPEQIQLSHRMLEAMQDDMARGHTPSVKADKRCAACSMKEICLPGLRRSPPVAAYLQRAAEEGAE